MNVVSLKDVVLEEKDGSWRRRSRIKMQWDNKWFPGIIVDMEYEEEESEGDLPISKLLEQRDTDVDSDSDDNIPLSHYVSTTNNTGRHAQLQQSARTSITHAPASPSPYATVSEASVDVSHMLDRLNPEEYIVDGEERHDVNCEDTGDSSFRELRRLQVKRCRSKGLAYMTEKTNVDKSERKVLSRCSNPAYCKQRNFMCHRITQTRRHALIKSYYSMATLRDQRQWLSKHVMQTSPTLSRITPSRKSRTLQYYLPSVNGQHLRVRRQMFLNTLNVSEKHMRTVLKKLSREGELEKDLRGGRVNSLAQRDLEIREQMEEHINRFPRMESHYCRQYSKYEYLSPDLTARKMYEMFKNEANEGSYSTYCNILRDLKLKIHLPKKDMCGLCATYRAAEKNAEVDQSLGDTFQKHEMEKIKVREIKKKLKNEALPSDVLACFDLEQVLYLPTSNRW